MASAGCETLSLLHCNARSLNKNIDSLVTIVSRLTFDCSIIAISETWLKEREFINIPNYNFLSLPRKTDSRGGGVALYLSTAIAFKQLKDITETQSEYEMLFVELATEITIGVIYRPPGSRMQAFLKHFEDLLQHFATTNKKVIICGDFNINIADTSSTDYLNLLCSYGFQNHITSPTRVTEVSSSIIDHILSNFCPSSVEAGVIAENVADHYPTYIIAPNTHPSNIKHIPYQAQRWDYERTRTAIQEKNFNEGLGNEDLNNDVNLTYERFSVNLRSSCIKSNCNSRRSLYLSTPICPWMTNNILKVIKKKDYWLNKMKQHKHNDYYKEQYRTMRNFLQSLIRKQKKDYYSKLILKNNGNTKEIWRIINSVMKPAQKLSILPDLSILNCDQVTLAEKFNDFFINISNTLTNIYSNEPAPLLPPPIINSFAFREITTTEIIAMTREMQSNKAMGHDEISINILKANIDILCHPLEKIFNKSFYAGIYPEQLKIGRVVPIFKGEDPNCVENYRPITILSSINILFEKLIAKRVMEFIEKYEILTTNQHGFRKNYSSTTAVSAVTDVINQALNNNQITIGIFLDIQKAFDCVDHDILLQKLERYGFRGPSLNFFRSYLSNRKQFVHIADSKSGLKTVQAGVPQGSVLGPILFSLFINDYPTSLNHADAVIYADDTALLVSHHSLKQAETQANLELRETLKWFNRNKLVLNIKKTKFIVFCSNQKQVTYDCKLYIENAALSNVEKYKYLGVTIDKSMHWAPHIRELSKKLSFGCYTLLQARKHFDAKTLRIIYFSIFHCHLSYCIESWGYTFASYSSVIAKLQKRAMRIITYAHTTAPSSPIFSQLNIMPFNVTRDYKTTLLVQRALNKSNQSSVIIKPKRNTRHAQKCNFNLPKIHNVYGRRTISYLSAKLWNNVPVNIKMKSSNTSSLREFFMSEHYTSPC